MKNSFYISILQFILLEGFFSLEVSEEKIEKIFFKNPRPFEEKIFILRKT